MSTAAPSSSWTFVEPCCGSASIALALLGARRPLLPYQGSKWRFRKALLPLFEAAGFNGTPSAVRLDDVGPWGQVAAAAIRTHRPAVLERVRALDAENARVVFDRLQHQRVPERVEDYAAQFLFLQRLAYSGKAVGDRNGKWVSPGFNTSSAFGLPATERFGQVKPMIPSLLRVLEGYEQLAAAQVTGRRGPAQPPSAPSPNTLVYLDPPYAGSTRYPMGDLDRQGVVALASAWHQAGATVFISEGEPIDTLVQRGWHSQLLNAGRQDTSRFRGKQPEWLTWIGHD